MTDTKFPAHFKNIREQIERAKASSAGAAFSDFLSQRIPEITISPKAVIELAPEIVALTKDLAKDPTGVGQSFLNGMLAGYCAREGARLGAKTSKSRNPPLDLVIPAIAMTVSAMTKKESK